MCCLLRFFFFFLVVPRNPLFFLMRVKADGFERDFFLLSNEQATAALYNLESYFHGFSLGVWVHDCYYEVIFDWSELCSTVSSSSKLT